jgi:thymidylate synthase
MTNYLDLLKYVLENGQSRKGRTKEHYSSVNTLLFRHNMGDGFPAVTTKKLAFKTMLVELEGFIHAVTSKKWYQDRGCHIWDEWSNPSHDHDDDLGPIYGYQWRKFGPHNEDQFQKILNTLKVTPYSRRMVCSAWNPTDDMYMALPPCHFAWSVNTIGNKLNLNWVQRSCDMFLGVPFNIASYATLLHLMAKECNMEEGELTGVLWDAHIYHNHIDQVKLQLSRDPYPLPTIETNWKGDIYKWTHEDSILKDYKHHPSIKGDVAV